MQQYAFPVILGLSVLSTVTMLLLVALELLQAANARKLLDRRLMETKLELRRLRRDLKGGRRSPPPCQNPPGGNQCP